jgi:hypothetical protein
VKGTIATEGLPGAPTATVFRVRTAPSGAAAEIAGTTRAVRAERTSRSARRRANATVEVAVTSM